MQHLTAICFKCIVFVAFFAPEVVSGCESDALSAQIDSIRRANDISASAYFTVGPEGLIKLSTCGTRAWGSAQAFSADDLIRIGSITKTFTALTVMRLVEARKLTLEQKLSEVLAQPPLTNPWRSTHPVRVAHLLEHTAGLADLSKKEFDFNEPVDLQAAFDVDPGSRTLHWPAGLHSSYSNSGAGILSHVVEVVTKQPFANVLDQQVLEPLGLVSASLKFDELQREKLITGYDKDGRRPIPYWHTLYRAFGGLNISTRDMIPFVRIFVDGGRIDGSQFLEAASLTRMRGPQTTLAAKAGLEYGYGLGMYQYQHRGVSFFGHGGDADGYLSFFAFSKTLDRGYFVVINAFNNRALREMRKAIENSLITSPSDEAKSMPLKASAFADLVGRYEQITHRFRSSSAPRELVVGYDDGGLFTQARNRGKQYLHATDSLLFRYHDETVASLAFIRCAGGVYLQGDLGNYRQRGATAIEHCSP